MEGVGVGVGIIMITGILLFIFMSVIRDICERHDGD